MEYNISDYIPHKVSEVICLKCLNRWFSVRPVNVLLKKIQCPNCYCSGFTIETGEDIDADI
jgi:Zn finger protein HypA/HybF involved in hydrogenase expression